MEIEFSYDFNGKNNWYKYDVKRYSNIVIAKPVLTTDFLFPRIEFDIVTRYTEQPVRDVSIYFSDELLFNVTYEKRKVKGCKLTESDEYRVNKRYLPPPIKKGKPKSIVTTRGALHWKHAMKAIRDGTDKGLEIIARDLALRDHSRVNKAVKHRYTKERLSESRERVARIYKIYVDYFIPQ